MGMTVNVFSMFGRLEQHKQQERDQGKSVTKNTQERRRREEQTSQRTVDQLAQSELR